MKIKLFPFPEPEEASPKAVSKKLLQVLDTTVTIKQDTNGEERYCLEWRLQKLVGEMALFTYLHPYLKGFLTTLVTAVACVWSCLYSVVLNLTCYIILLHISWLLAPTGTVYCKSTVMTCLMNGVSIGILLWIVSIVPSHVGSGSCFSSPHSLVSVWFFRKAFKLIFKSLACDNSGRYVALWKLTYQFLSWENHVKRWTDMCPWGVWLKAAVFSSGVLNQSHNSAWQLKAVCLFSWASVWQESQKQCITDAANAAIYSYNKRVLVFF